VFYLITDAAGCFDFFNQANGKTVFERKGILAEIINPWLAEMKE
jgi:hypothetical protein